MNNCRVEFVKYGLSGIIEGLKINEKMSFVSWDAACKWAGEVTTSLNTNYVILEMVNLETGEKEFF